MKECLAADLCMELGLGVGLLQALPRAFQVRERDADTKHLKCNSRNKSYSNSSIDLVAFTYFMDQNDKDMILIHVH